MTTSGASPWRRGDTVRRIKVQKKSLGGEVVHEYEGELLHQDEQSVTLEALFTRNDMLFMDVVFKKDDRFVEYYYFNRWYNIFEIHDRDDDHLKGWYCNIGLPAVIKDEVVSYVDLALDLWVSTNGNQTVLDEDEFNSLALSDEMRASALTWLEDLKNLFTQCRIIK